jgi:hypothetical protein
MFSASELNKALKTDNPTYERVLTSDLNALVALLVKGGFTAQQVAAEMKKISGVKWQKYKLTRAYLIREIAMLANLVRADLVNFKTQSLTALPGGNVKHDAVWQSDSGDLQDLAYAFVREKVYWDAPSTAAKPYLDPAYQVAGQHFGVGNAVTSPGNALNMSDTHDAKGAWAPAVFNFKGPGSISYTCKQVYQWSKDNKVTWLDIPNSNYEIKREVSVQGTQIKMTIKKKNIAPNTVGENCSNSLLA